MVGNVAVYNIQDVSESKNDSDDQNYIISIL